MSGYTLLEPDMEERCDALVRAAEVRGIPCSVDLEGIGTSGRRTTLDRVLTFCNVEEFRGYFNSDDPVAACATRRDAHPLVLKAGPDGSYLVAAASVAHVPTGPVDGPIDTTGAGDAFDAAFIAARLRGLDDASACRWGNRAGAATVRVRAPRASLNLTVIEAPLSG